MVSGVSNVGASSFLTRTGSPAEAEPVTELEAVVNSFTFHHLSISVLLPSATSIDQSVLLPSVRQIPLVSQFAPTIDPITCCLLWTFANSFEYFISLLSCVPLAHFGRVES